MALADRVFLRDIPVFLDQTGHSEAKYHHHHHCYHQCNSMFLKDSRNQFGTKHIIYVSACM